MDGDCQAGSKTMFTPDIQLSKQGKDRRENISVFVRVRPMNTHERTKMALNVVDCPGFREVVCKDRGVANVSKTFTFDRVFGPLSKQIDVYKAVAAPLIEEVLQGYNCTVFAYGQTGTGKTFTMEGERSQQEVAHSWESDPLAGIVPRAMSQLFDELRITNSEFTVRVSLVEMYNEEVYDLLSPCSEDQKPRTVRLYEDSKLKGHVHIQGLEEVIVHNKHEVYGILERGSQMRKTASTLLNANSSRSHTVFTVTVHIKESNPMGEDLVKIGKLNLVDLAGSENIGRSGAVDKRAREAGNINQSLLTLGRVITALVERTPHIPYRESKLTRLLQDSLGGKTKTSIIATISPASINLEETLSTLDYAHRAKNIQNRPEVNQKLTKKAMLKEYTEEIERLRRDLLAAREKNGIFVDKENYDRMMSQIESQGQDLSEKIQYTRKLEEEVEENKLVIAAKDAILEEMRTDLETANMIIADLESANTAMQQQLQDVENQKVEMEVLVQAHTDTEKRLTKEAISILDVATDSSTRLDAMFSRLERKKSVEKLNIEAGQRFRTYFDEDLKRIANDVNLFREKHAEYSGVQRLQLDEKAMAKENYYKMLAQNLEKHDENMRLQMKVFMSMIQGSNEEIRRIIDEGLKTDLACIEKTKSELGDHCEEVSTTAEDIHQRLYLQSGKLNEFWDSTYLIDTPTGATPQKKAYDFPRNLSQTSPHHRILDRFRRKIVVTPLRTLNENLTSP